MCSDPVLEAFCGIFYVFGSCFRTLAVILVSDFHFIFVSHYHGVMQTPL